MAGFRLIFNQEAAELLGAFAGRQGLSINLALEGILRDDFDSITSKWGSQSCEVSVPNVTNVRGGGSFAEIRFNEAATTWIRQSAARAGHELGECVRAMVEESLDTEGPSWREQGCKITGVESLCSEPA